MIDNTDPQQVEDAMTETASDACRMAFLDARDTTGLVLEEAVVRVVYRLPGEVLNHSLEIHLMVDKKEFEDMFMEFAKERLMNDAKRLLNLPTDDRDGQYGLSTDDPETPE